MDSLKMVETQRVKGPRFGLAETTVDSSHNCPYKLGPSYFRMLEGVLFR